MTQKNPPPESQNKIEGAMAEAKVHREKQEGESDASS